MTEPTDTGYYQDGGRLLHWNGRAWIDSDSGEPVDQATSLAAAIATMHSFETPTGAGPVEHDRRSPFASRRAWPIAILIIIVLLIAGVALVLVRPWSAASTVASPSPSETSTRLPTTGPGIYTGTGNASITILKPTKAVALLQVTMDGSASGFSITSGTGGDAARVANGSGPWSGTTLTDVGTGPKNSVELTIKYPGKWTLTVKPAAIAPVLEGTVSSNTYKVYQHSAPAIRPVVVSSADTGPLRVVAVSATGKQTVLVDARDPLDQSVSLPTGSVLVWVQSNKRWSITPG